MKIKTLITIIIIGLTTMNCSTSDKRILPVEGAYNVRDLGGYRTMDNGQTKWNMIYRSGDLNELSENDLSLLKNRGLKTVIDFRTLDEQEDMPSKLPNTVENIMDLPISAGNVIDLSKIKNHQDATQAMININVYFVDDAKNQYRDFFKILMDGKNAPLLFHCSAGKDRTGFAAALILSSLGVSRETIYQDYLLSALYVEKKYAPYVNEAPYLAPVFTVKKEYLKAAFDKIEAEYGSVDNYLVNELKVDLEKMKYLYTTK